MSRENLEEQENIVWQLFEIPLIDNNIPENSNDLALFYVANYIQAIQALHNMKNIIYKIVDKYQLNDQQGHRLNQIMSMKEEEYRIYHGAASIINSGDNLFNINKDLKVLAEIRKKFGSIERFNEMPVQERENFLGITLIVPDANNEV